MNGNLLRRVVIAVLCSTALLHAQEPKHPNPKVAWKVALTSPSFGSAAVADIDDDGRLEVAFGTYFGDNSVRVLNGEDGSEYWRYNAGFACLDASLRFCDINGNGKLELVVPVSNKGWVLAFDAKTGNELWKYGTQPTECTDTPPAILDVDSDGDVEVVYGTFKGRLHVIAGKSGKKKRVYDVVSHFVQTGASVLDLNGDGRRDYVCATFKGDNCVHAVDGKTGKELWKFQVPGKHMGMYHGCSVGDVTGDGKPELVIGAYDGKVYCLAADGKKLWEAAPPDRFFMSPTVLADLDGDGSLEVVTASQRVSVISSKGKVLWSKVASKGAFDSATRGVSIADLDGDQKLDIAVLSGAGMFRVFAGKDGALLYDFDAATLTKKRIVSSSHGVTIADLTGDGKLDVFFVVGATRPEKHGLAVCLTGFAGTGRGWYMLRHDPQNTGNLSTKLAPGLLKRIENLRPRKTAVMKPAQPPKVGRVPQARVRNSPKKTNKKVLELARARGIPKGVMEAALAANGYPVAADKVREFATKGDHAFAATCLLIESGHANVGTVQLLAATYKPGDEKLLRKLADGPDLPKFGKWSALRGLGVADTKETRSYLLERLATERDAGHFMSIAQALAMLEEKRGATVIAKQILKFEERWGGVEIYLLQALDGTAGRGSIPWLVKYLADKRGSNFVTVLLQLQKHDKAEAVAQAKQLLASKRGKRLTDLQRRQVRRIAYE